MYQSIRFAIAFLGLAVAANCAMAQLPSAAAEHALLKKDVGTWKAKVKLYMGPDGRADENATPMESEGEEVGQMVGEMWVVSVFKGSFAGFDFVGQGTSGYDPKLKKYVGSWIDSTNPHAMHMTGTYDAETKTLTSMTTGIDMMGNESKGKSLMVYVDDDHRTMTSYEIRDGKEVKSMEIEYSRVK